MPLAPPCICGCHNVYRGTQRASQQMGKYMKGFTYAERANQWDAYGCAFTDDVVAAAAACPVCINEHCPALLSEKSLARPRVVKRRKRFNPNSDSQTTDTQADGEKGNEDGG